MRDVIILILVLGTTLSALRRPWIGVLGWTWISLMNPHKQTWGFMTSFPVAACIGGATLVGLIATRDRVGGIFTGSARVDLLFFLWMAICCPFAFYPDLAWPMLIKIFKIQLMVFVAIGLLYGQRQIEMLVLTIVASLAYYGVKGGIFTITTGGSYRVWGPDDTFISGNNELALALIITIPLMRYLQLQTVRRWKKNAWGMGIFLMAVSAIGSHSRGALLAIAAMGGLLILRSRNRFGMLVLALVAVAFVVSFMPSEWGARMGTIQTYDADTSAMSRVDAWHMAFNVARSNPFGGGFDMWSPAIYSIYYPEARLIVVAHSIYFHVLGESGFVGLGLFLIMWWVLWRELGHIRKATHGKPDVSWMNDLAGLCQVSLVGYLVGGAFLSLPYFDLPYNLIVISISLNRMLNRPATLPAPASIPRVFSRILQ